MKPPFNINEVLRACRRQDPQAQRQLYEHYYAYGLTVCLHYTAKREAAEEILHDAFLKVFEKLEDFRGEADFRYWFRRVVVRTAIDAYRKNKRRQEKEALVIDMAPDRPAENDALRQLSHDDVLRCLQQLPPSYRMVTTLHLLEGYTHKEVAAMLGISEGTSKSNYAKARQKLAKYASRFFSAFPITL